MIDPLKELELTLTSPRRRSPGTISTYMSTARAFLTWLGDGKTPTERDLRLYFVERETQGISQNTRRTQFAQLKKLFDANNWPWPFTSQDRPGAPEDIFEPAFTEAEVLQLISAREEFTPQQRFYLALSTTYGMRSEELSKVTKRTLQADTITIRAVHRSRQRQHLIPEEIADVLSAWRPRERTARAVRDHFQPMLVKAGLGQRPGWGFHAVRRTLVTLLGFYLPKNGYNPALVGHWMGWSKQRAGSTFAGAEMAGVYSHPEILYSDPWGLDRLIFSVNPFVSAWREN